MGPAPGPPVEAVEHGGGPQLLVVAQREAVEGQGHLDVLLDPVAQLGQEGLPSGQPDDQVAPGLFDVSPLVEPAEFDERVVLHLSMSVLQGVSQRAHAAPLPEGLGQDLSDGEAKAFVGLAEDQPGQWPGVMVLNEPGACRVKIHTNPSI